MISLIVALLLTVGQAQPPLSADQVSQQARQKGEKIRRLGKMSLDLADVQTQLWKAKLNLEQVNVAEQAEIDELSGRNDELQSLRGEIIVLEAMLGRLDKDDPKKADPTIQKEKERLA